MDKYFFIQFFMRARYFLPVITTVAALIIGIVVTVIKVKQTKILGLSVIFTALSGFVSAGYTLYAMYFGSVAIARLANAQTILVFVFSLASSFCMCFYMLRVYKKKYIYIPILLLPFVGRIINVVNASLITRLSSGGYDGGIVMAYRISLAQNLNNLIISTAVSLIVIIVFYKHRKIEKVVPHTHVVCIITLVWNFIQQGYLVFYYLMMSIDPMSGYTSSALSDFLLYRSGYFVMFFTVFGALAGLIFPVYLLISVIKASRKGDEEPEPVLAGEVDMPSTEETEFSQPDEPS